MKMLSIKLRNNFAIALIRLARRLTTIGYVDDALTEALRHQKNWAIYYDVL